MPQVPDNILNKIKRCLAMAQDGRGNPNEAATALRQAQKLMEQYNVSEEGLVMADIAEEEATSVAWRQPPRWETNLAAMIGSAFGCKLYLRHGYSKCAQYPQGKLGRYVYIGLKHQAQLASYTFTVLRREALRAREYFLKEEGLVYITRGEKIAAGESFCRGYIGNVERQVNALANRPEVEQALQKLLDQRVTGKYAPPNKGSNSTAAYAGSEAGKRATLHRPMDGREQVKLK